MATLTIQNQINEAQNIKSAMLKIEDMREPSQIVSVKEAKTNASNYDKLEEKYTKLYDKLVKNAVKNNWSISEYETNDFFDYETFDDDVNEAR